MDVRVARLYAVDYAFIVLAFGLGGVVPPPAQQPPAATRHRRASGQHLLSLSGPDRIPAMQCAAPGQRRKRPTSIRVPRAWASRRDWILKWAVDEY
jgi:hypothetical protein